MHHLHMLHEKEPGLYGQIFEIVWEISVRLNDYGWVIPKPGLTDREYTCKR